ncbi:MAG: hypothetical protein IPP74_12910 [Alphaproteobacteria bacterium]|nr:hypothetical protein [Alphaproteobacteria bacterium]
MVYRQEKQDENPCIIVYQGMNFPLREFPNLSEALFINKTISHWFISDDLIMKWVIVCDSVSMIEHHRHNLMHWFFYQLKMKGKGESMEAIEKRINDKVHFILSQTPIPLPIDIFKNHIAAVLAPEQAVIIIHPWEGFLEKLMNCSTITSD